MNQYLLIFRWPDHRKNDCVVVSAADEAQARDLGRQIELHADLELLKLRRLEADSGS